LKTKITAIKYDEKNLAIYLLSEDAKFCEIFVEAEPFLLSARNFSLFQKPKKSLYDVFREMVLEGAEDVHGLIYKEKNGEFFSKLIIDGEETDLIPNELIGLLGLKYPIYVLDEILQEDQKFDTLNKDQSIAYLDNEIKKALEDEDYEKAAKLKERKMKLENEQTG